MDSGGIAPEPRELSKRTDAYSLRSKQRADAGICHCASSSRYLGPTMYICIDINDIWSLNFGLVKAF